MTRLIRIALIGLGMLAGARTSTPLALAAGDPADGAKAFEVCSACHSLRPDLNMTCPSLANVWDRKAGSLPGFDRYSAALKASGVTWDAKTLDAWLENPARFIPGNWMTYAGVHDPTVRADLIAFLRAIGETRNGVPAVSVPTAYTETPKDLKRLAPNRQVTAIRSCRDSYFVTTADVRTRPFWDESLRFETDASRFGPVSGAPAILPAGMFGDRAAVIFSKPEEISTFIKSSC